MRPNFTISRRLSWAATISRRFLRAILMELGSLYRLIRMVTSLPGIDDLPRRLGVFEISRSQRAVPDASWLCMAIVGRARESGRGGATFSLARNGATSAR